MVVLWLAQGFTSLFSHPSTCSPIRISVYRHIQPILQVPEGSIVRKRCTMPCHNVGSYTLMNVYEHCNRHACEECAIIGNVLRSETDLHCPHVTDLHNDSES